MADEKADKARAPTINHVVYCNGQPVFSCDDTDERAELKCQSEAVAAYNRAKASGGKAEVVVKANRIPKE